MIYTGLEFRLEVFLGVTEKERENVQIVNLIFEFKNDFSQGCLNNDYSNEYFCYQKIMQEIYQRFHRKEVRLLEFLCYQIHSIIKSKLPNGTLVNVYIKKKIPNIIGKEEANAYCKCVEFKGKI